MSKFVCNQLKYGFIEEYFEHNGLKEGIYKIYWSNGQPQVISNYINNIENGVRLEYHQNGHLHKKLNIINNKTNGKYKIYTDCDNLVVVCDFLDNKKMGHATHIIKIPF